MKPTKKWEKMSDVYKFFSQNYPMMDFSENAAVKMFKAESLGGEYNFQYHETINEKFNGYAVGKHLMDLQLTMWLEDLSQFGMLTKAELFLDKNLESIRWFLMDFFGYTEDAYKDLLSDIKTRKLCSSTLDEHLKDKVYKYINI